MDHMGNSKIMVIFTCHINHLNHPPIIPPCRKYDRYVPYWNWRIVEWCHGHSSPFPTETPPNTTRLAWAFKQKWLPRYHQEKSREKTSWRVEKMKFWWVCFIVIVLKIIMYVSRSNFISIPLPSIFGSWESLVFQFPIICFRGVTQKIGSR